MHVHNLNEGHDAEPGVIATHNLDTVMPLLHHERVHGSADAEAPTEQWAQADELLGQLDRDTLHCMLLVLAANYYAASDLVMHLATPEQREEIQNTGTVAGAGE